MFRVPLTRFLLYDDFDGVPLVVVQQLIDGFPRRPLRSDPCVGEAATR
jgi:hypothetical protein